MNVSNLQRAENCPPSAELMNLINLVNSRDAMNPEERTKRIERLANVAKESTVFRGRQRAQHTLDILIAALKAPDNSLFKEVDTGRRHELKNLLRACFGSDLRRWLHEKDNRLDQYILDLPSAEGLALTRVGTLVRDGARRFWFHQLSRFSTGDHTLVTFSEPLFFFSARLQSYVRLLDIDQEGSLSENRPALVARAEQAIVAGILDASEGGLDRKSVEASVRALGLAPVRLYVPAGDAYGASRIRSWFRTQVEGQPKRHEVSRGQADELFSSHNRIILASRNTNRELEKFRLATLPLLNETGRESLDMDITGKGIRIGREHINDVIGQAGTEVSHVVVTNWVFPKAGGRAVTVVASQHSRALGRVCEYLRSGEISPDKLLTPDGRIPERVQFAFKVGLESSDFTAGDPEPIGEPVIYDKVLT